MHRCPKCFDFCWCETVEDRGEDPIYCEHCDESAVDEELLYEDAIDI